MTRGISLKTLEKQPTDIKLRNGVSPFYTRKIANLLATLSDKFSEHKEEEKKHGLTGDFS